MPNRIVHLQGGLRAIDDRSGTVSIETANKAKRLAFSTPDYPRLYLALQKMGFEVIGVEFATSDPSDAAPDWWLASPEGGFRLEAERRAWVEIRHQALTELQVELVDISQRSATLLHLIAIRLYQMSTAYKHTLQATGSGSAEVSDGLFDNTYSPYIAAAVHAFSGEAASLRDAISEIIWHHVLGEKDEVRSFKTFRSRAKSCDNPLASRVIAEGQNGCIKEISQLRNRIFHSAPLGSQHMLPSCMTYRLPVQNRGILAIKYCILDQDDDFETLLQSALSKGTMSEIKGRVEVHLDRVRQGKDALNYAWRTADNLLGLLREARHASSLKGSIPTLTSKDLVERSSLA